MLIYFFFNKSVFSIWGFKVETEDTWTIEKGFEVA